ncbi:MAG TPA: VOC family protein [Candidatus Synoicihabitans sp.]|nr:VOC family protein [Candidatus Synoicihabitans sp.]
MKQHLTYVTLLVRDYDEALVYYTQVLGFELIENAVVSSGKRWVVVAPRGATETRLLLARAQGETQERRVGDQTGGRVGFFLHSREFAADYARLVARGVAFEESPRQESYGTVAVFRDLYGNRWDLLQLDRSGPAAAEPVPADSIGIAFPMTTALPPPELPEIRHLRLLALFHYIVGGIGCFFACFPLIHVGLGLLMIVNPEAIAEGNGDAPPAAVGYFFAGLGLLFVLLGWAMAICTIVSGRMIARRRHRTFSIVVAAVLCMFMPFGTVLGVFTLIVLTKDSVQRLYTEGPRDASGRVVA